MLSPSYAIGRPNIVIIALAFIRAGVLRHPGVAAVCIALAFMALACSSGAEDAERDERVLELEYKTQTLEESVEALENENAELRNELATLREDKGELETRIQELEDAGPKAEVEVNDKDLWSVSKEEKPLLPDGAVHEATARLAEEFGGQVSYLDHPYRQVPAVLVTPQAVVDGETPLVVSLHGFGENAANHSAYFPLHERVNSDGFALLLPTGAIDAAGVPFWNPTDQCCEGGKTGEDDVAYLAELVDNARETREFGPVYFFGYSNGGFMSYHMACKGLPGLRAVASLAGTSYVEDSSCDGAPPVSVLHIHGTADEVILFEGDSIEQGQEETGESAFYAGAQEVVTRWSRRAGCDWPEEPQPYATLDLDRYVPGAETEAFRLNSGCADGITIELWVGEGSGHTPGYGEAFLDALLDWLLSQ